MHCHASRSKSCQAAMLSAESCFTVKASEPEPKLDCGYAAGHYAEGKASWHVDSQEDGVVNTPKKSDRILAEEWTD